MWGLYLGIGLLVLLSLFLFSLRLIFRKTFYNDRKRTPALYEMPRGFGEMPEDMRGKVAVLDAMPYQAVTITARDGTRLFARYYHVADGAPLDIHCHGYRGMAVRDFCGATPFALDEGHNVLLIDERACGKSEGTVVTFGVRERFDILDWVAYAGERFPDVPIFLGGISMGGAAVLMAAGEALPASVVGVIADCPYSTPRDIICSVIKMMHLPPRPLYPLVSLSARLFGGFSLEDASAREAVKKSRVPLLLIHGDADRLVPYEMSCEMVAAAPHCTTLVTFAGADHGMSFMSDHALYIDTVRGFYEKCLGNVNKT